MHCLICYTEAVQPLFYLILFTLALGVGGIAYGICEWACHHRKHKAVLLWSAGLVFLNWYQIPTLIALSGKQIVLTNFNPLLSLALPIAFLGFGLIFLGSLSTISRIKTSTIILSFVWFTAALIFYGYYYGGTGPLQSIWLVIGSNALFFTPIFLLNLGIAIVMYRRMLRIGSLSLTIGLWAYIFASCLGLVRSGLSLYFGLTYPPQFAALRFFATPFIIAQAAGLILFLVSFTLLHRNMEKLPDASADYSRDKTFAR